MGQSLEETRHRLPRVLSQQSQRMALHKQEGVELMPVRGYLPGKLLEAQHPGFYILKPQTSRRKAGVQHKPYYLYNQCGHSEPLLPSVGMVGTFLKSKFQDASQGPTTPFKGEKSGCCFNLFFFFCTKGQTVWTINSAVVVQTQP